MHNIHPNAQIGDNAQIGSFVTIQDEVTIGNNVKIGPNAVILSGTQIGDDCSIHSGAVVGGDPQDLKYNGESTLLKIGNNVSIREFCTINRGTTDRGETVIGNNCLLMAYVHVAHDCVLGNNVIMSNTVNLAGHVEIDDFAILGGGTLVHQFVHIGKHVMVGGGSLVRKDVPPFVKAAREPLSYIGINSIGLQRRGFNQEVITSIQGIYRQIYQKSSNTAKAVEDVKAQFAESSERDEILDFISNSERGIMKGFAS